MMYWIRCAMLSVGIFFLAYIVLSAVLALAWRWLRSRRLIENADTLFTLRTLPLIIALMLVALVTIPSFWSLEPAVSDEGIGWPIATLFAASLLWMVFRGLRVLAALRHASRFFALDSASVLRLDIAPGLPAYELPDSGPNLFVAGLWRPRLFISRGALAMLDAQEMQAAIRHELAHAQGRDNLKQLVVRFCNFPALSSLDQEWLRAAEAAADDRAATDESLAADLASALIKVGTASARLTVPELSMSLVP
jgi:Zn-dependent protease with chaperone function